MNNNKTKILNFIERLSLFFILSFIIINGILHSDSYIAIISAICGITYTFFAGKGFPICYIFGIIGSSFYSYLSFQNALWGNLLLYAGYYIPMQILGYYKWNRHLKKDKNEILKISLSARELTILIFILIVFSFVIYYLLLYLKDGHPLLDSTTTVFSIGGMYLTVRRAIEQWIFWMFVNTLSLAMWIKVALTGEPVLSTVIMWGVYLILAIYFYINWHKEVYSK
ncbi:nicotinamide mononucleotide transporter [bacterium]|nr:nicotinamide mononucleotide transporter [bacterium]